MERKQHLNYKANHPAPSS